MQYANSAFWVAYFEEVSIFMHTDLICEFQKLSVVNKILSTKTRTINADVDLEEVDLSSFM